MAFGTVAIVGRSNVGKSTFLNRVLGEDLAVVSHLPQTTRDTLLGVVDVADAQLAFLDTPGLHKPKSELGRRMNAAALEAARGADVVLFMTDVTPLKRARAGRKTASPAEQELDPEDVSLLARLPEPERVPSVLVVNKVDLIRDKSRLLPLIDAFSKQRPWSAIVPTSITRNEGVDAVLDELRRVLPEGPKAFEDDTLTDRPMSFFAREYVREQVLKHARAEVPHAVAVSIDRFDEGPKAAEIGVTLHVEKVGQRKILIGRGGEGLRTIREGAEARIAALLGKKVRLSLFVRVTPRWKDVPRQLAELGYETTPEPPGSGSGAPTLPRRAKRARRRTR